MKKMLALALCVLLLAGCTAPVVETTTPPEPEYIGNSPVPNLRTGIMAQGTTALCNGVEVTNQGVYFFAEMDMGQYLMYVDHDGTEAVKLCSRPDCAHDSNTCNAFFPSATNVCAYNGHLYIETGFGASVEITRLDMDGNNRTVVLDRSLTPSGYRGSSGTYLTNGVFIFNLFKLDETGTEITDQFYWKLDGSMNQPVLMPEVSMYYSHGGAILMLDHDTDTLYQWSPDTNELSGLTELSAKEPGYCGTEECWYVEDGSVVRLRYADQQTEQMLATGLDGCYAFHGFPDCFVLSEFVPYEEQDDRQLTSQTLHFYNWDMEELGTAKLDFPVYSPIDYMRIICAETENRIYLAAHFYGMPEYYIEKSDLGKGKVPIHPLELPQDIRDYYHEMYLDPWEE